MKQFEILRQLITIRELLVAVRDGFDSFGYEDIVQETKKIEKQVVELGRKAEEAFAE